MFHSLSYFGEESPPARMLNLGEPISVSRPCSKPRLEEGESGRTEGITGHPRGNNHQEGHNASNCTYVSFLDYVRRQTS